jgi:hypothetical protein
MASDHVVTADAGEGPFTNPWPVLWAGLASLALALVWFWALGDTATPLRLFLLGAGLLATAAAVAIRPASPIILALAAVGAAVAWGGSSPEWDSARLLLGVFGLVAGGAAVLLLLPRLVRRLIVTLLVFLHFGGIVTAVLSVPPQPWLASVVWTYWYRPYLEFMYLNNAYHFYSPDPGPASLLWFRVQYEDGSARWVKLPNRKDFPLGHNYQRRLSLTESTNQLVAGSANFELRLRYRMEAGNQREIPMHPEVAPGFQYREPSYYSRWMLKSYARHVIHHYPHLEDPSQKAVAVKIYRVVHNIPLARDLADGLDPFDETTYVPYYQGEYDPEGNLKEPQDPFLYWLIPILKKEKSNVFRSGVGAAGRKPDPRDVELKDYVKIHAGDRTE